MAIVTLQQKPINRVRYSASGGGGGTAKLLTISGSTDATHVNWTPSSTYLGAFRLDGGDHGSSPYGVNLSYANVPVIGIGSASNKLLVSGRDTGGTRTIRTLAEFTIPATLSTSTTKSSLPIAACTQDFIDVLGPPSDSDTWDEGKVLGGIATINGMVVVNGYSYYDNPPYTQDTTAVLTNAANLSGSTKRGFFKTGGARVGGWITPIPTAYQAALGGTHIFGQSTGKQHAVLSRFSCGPSAYVYDSGASNAITGSAPPSNGATVSLTAILDYPYGSNSLGGDPATSWNNSGTVFNNISSPSIGLIVPGTKTYMVIGYSGGHVSGSQYWDPHPPWSDYKGYGPNTESDLYSYYWLYNMDDLLAVKAGTDATYVPQPYEHGQMSIAFDNGPGDNELHIPNGATFDPSNSRLYIVLDRADNTQGVESDIAMIVCYDLSGFA